MTLEKVCVHRMRVCRWVLKEGGITGGWNLRYFVATGDRLEYFKEEKVSVSRPGEKPGALLVSLGLSLDCTNVVCAAPGVAQPKDRPLLHEGDVVIGINGEPVVNRPAQAVLESVPAGSVAFTLLRPRGRVALHGASVVSVGPRKHGGGHVLSVSVSDPNARRSRYTLVCADERVCAAWVGSIKEAIAASAMEEIKNAVRARSPPSKISQRAPPEPAIATTALGSFMRSASPNQSARVSARACVSLSLTHSLAVSLFLFYSAVASAAVPGAPE